MSAWPLDNPIHSWSFMNFMNHLFARNPKENDIRKSLELEVTTISKTIIENM